MEPSTAIVIVAGGSGQRCGGGVPKQFRLLGGEPVLARTINLFARTLPGAEIVAVLPEEHIPFWKNLSARFEVAAHTLAAGGDDRFGSVRNGLAALQSAPELIAVHDGVRPLASPELIRRIVESADEQGAAIPAVQPADSFRVTEGGASRIVDRSCLRAVQTPQAFRAEWLRNAYDTAPDASFTDDAAVVERAGHGICLVEGEPTNLKLTTPTDFIVAEALLAAREADDGPDDESRESPRP